MAQKLFARAVEPFPLTGMMLGNIPVDQLMLDAQTISDLITSKIAGGWRAGGSLNAAGIVDTLLVAGNEGKVYNLNEAFTTTSSFVEGAGKWYNAGTNIAVINNGSVDTPEYKFDVLGGTDQSVIRVISAGTTELTPVNGGVALPAATDTQLGLVTLTDDPTATDSLTAHIAITPLALSGALSDITANVSAISSDLSTLSGDFGTFVENTNGNIDALSDAISAVSDDLSSLSSSYEAHGHGNIDHDGILKSGNTAQANKVVITDSTGAIVAGEYDGTYDSSTNKIATQSTVSTAVTTAVEALDVSDITGFGPGKTLSTLIETDGLISATFQDIAITESQITNKYEALRTAISTLTLEKPLTLSTTIDLLMDVVGALSAVGV